MPGLGWSLTAIHLLLLQLILSSTIHQSTLISASNPASYPTLQKTPNPTFHTASNTVLHSTSHPTFQAASTPVLVFSTASNPAPYTAFNPTYQPASNPTSHKTSIPGLRAKSPSLTQVRPKIIFPIIEFIHALTELFKYFYDTISDKMHF